MKTSMDVFDKIRELSPRTLTARPRVLLTVIADEMGITQDDLLVLLAELKNRGLVQIHTGTPPSVSLTNYGTENENPSGGVHADEPLS